MVVLLLLSTRAGDNAFARILRDAAMICKCIRSRATIRVAIRDDPFLFRSKFKVAQQDVCRMVIAAQCLTTRYIVANWMFIIDDVDAVAANGDGSGSVDIVGVAITISWSESSLRLLIWLLLGRASRLLSDRQ